MTITNTARIIIQTEDFNLQEQYDQLRSLTSGAIVTFTGLVRDFDTLSELPSNINADSAPSEKVENLFLQHYPGMTEKLLADIVADAQRRWPIEGVRVIHRVGELLPGDQIVLVAVSSAHRQAAFDAANFIMDYLKTRATFWKKTRKGKQQHWLAMKDSDKQAAKRWQEGGSNVYKEQQKERLKEPKEASQQ